MINENTSELIGAHVGDGTLYKSKNSVVWELRGVLDEKEYYNNNIVPLLNSIFLNNFKAKFRSGGKNGCFGVQTTKKEVTQFFIKNEFNPGPKSHTVRIPKYIKKASKKIKFAFIRGYFDTDGCLRFDKINKDKFHTYPRLEFSTVSINMVEDLFLMLKELGFKSFKWKSRTEYKLCLAGKENLSKFMTKIKPKNTKHLNKYFFWKEQGYYMLRSHSLVLRGHE